MNTAINLADSLFALMEARKDLDSLEQQRSQMRLSAKLAPVEHVAKYNAADERYTLACERYEAAVVDSCREALIRESRLLGPI